MSHESNLAARKVSLILPTKNEIDGMRAVFPKIDRSLFHEIIVVDGNSTDGTIEYARDQGLTVVIQPGKGVPDACEAAFRAFTGDIFLEFTPDGNSVPELLKPVIDKMNEGYDMVVVSRYLDGAHSDDDDFFTGIGNWGFTTLVNWLYWTRHTDAMVGFRAFTREAVERMRLMHLTEECWLRRNWFYMNSWELGSALRARRCGLTIAEIPGDEPARIGGARKMSILRNGSGALTQVLWDFLTFWPRKVEANKPLPLRMVAEEKVCS